MASILCRMLLFVIVSVSGVSLSHAQAKTATILLFGDSITAGYNLATEKSLSVQLEKFLRDKGREISVINGGVSGDTTTSGRNRLEWTLKKYNPDRVVIALGGNDMLRGFSPAVTHENLDVMLKLLQSKNIPAILTKVQAPANLGVEYMKNFNQIYPDLAQKYNIPLYPFLLEKTFNNPTLMQSDGIHPSAEGVSVMAEILGTQLLIDIPQGN